MTVNELGFLSPEIEQYRQRIRQRHAEFFDLIERASRCCHVVKTNFQVHNQDAQEVFASKDSRFRAACQVFLTGYRNAVIR